MSPDAGCCVGIPPPAEPDPDALILDATDEAAIRQHMEEHGYVVVGGMLSDERVKATVDELWQSPSLLGGHVGIEREDPSSWGSDAWPAGSRNFLDPLDPCAEVQSWRNRVDAGIARVFRALWQGRGAGGPGSCTGASAECGGDVRGLVVSADRFGVMRPTVVDDRERPSWRTSRNWLHWDQNPWALPEFDAFQGLLALSDAGADGGGFCTVPGFHREFAAWGQRHPEGSLAGACCSTLPLPVPAGDEAQRRRRKVLVPQGGLLVWDSRMPHENYPNEGRGWRIVQYVTCKRLVAADAAARAAAWRSGLRSGAVPANFARRFGRSEVELLGMVAACVAHADGTCRGDEDERQAEGHKLLEEALRVADSLSPEALEAARQWRRANRLKQVAIDPPTLQEATRLFREAFAVNPALREPLRHIRDAEKNYLPFWIL